MCYRYRVANAPKTSSGALAYGVTHPTCISKIKYESSSLINPYPDNPNQPESPLDDIRKMIQAT